jgi:hypothetical protein
MSSKMRFSPKPYGIWTTEDGTQVLFSRSYHPLFKRKPGEPAVPDDRDRWVHGIVQTKTVRFYNDYTFQFVAKRLRQIEQDYVAGKPILGFSDEHGEMPKEQATDVKGTVIQFAKK